MDRESAEQRALSFGEAVREACVRAALEGYERAAVDGLCHEGAFEAAVEAMRALDVGGLWREAASSR